MRKGWGIDGDEESDDSTDTGMTKSIPQLCLVLYAYDCVCVGVCVLQVSACVCMDGCQFLSELYAISAFAW